MDTITIRNRIADIRYEPRASVGKAIATFHPQRHDALPTNDDLYQRMTIRNVNTVRTLAAMLRES